MDQHSPVMAVLVNEADHEFANQVANALGYSYADVVMGSPLDAASALQARSSTPSYILVDIGDRKSDVLNEIDSMAEHCVAGTRVVVIGKENDVNLYRELRARGVIEYFTSPAKIADVRTAFLYDKSGPASGGGGSVISFMSAASGDGSSTIALNTAFCLAHEYKQRTVIIDMDYQFGMIAKNLDISSPFGIKELFEHPDRSIDTTLVDRMLVEYGGALKVIAAPNELRFLPAVKPEIIRDLIVTLQEKFDFIIIDLPHIWLPWIAAALNNSNHIVMVAQLWLRSATHASRLLGVMRDIGISEEAMSMVINRSGAKFKEAVGSKDFERVCNKSINFYLSNDIKTVVAAENQGKTILEVGNSPLERQFRDMAQGLMGLQEDDYKSGNPLQPSVKSGLTSLFKK